jgi:YidC/Oxa1 family membrane protein insertase
MEKRVLVAVFLSFLVLYAYQTLVVKPTPPKPRTAPSSQAGGGTAAVAEAPAAAPSGGSGAAPAAATSEIAALVADQAERHIVVETSTIRAVFTNRGAHLISWRLKNYLDYDKKPQELVPGDLPPGSALPFELKVDDPAVSSRLENALFHVSGSQDQVDARRQPQTLVFEFKDASGLSARKEFTFEPNGYVVRLTALVQDGDRSLNPTILWGPALGDVAASGESSRYLQKPEGVVFRGDKVQRIGGKDLVNQPVQEGDFTVAGVDDHYFMAVALPTKPVRVDFQPLTVLHPGQDPKSARDYVAFGVRQRQSATNLKFFFGPKDFDVLEATEPRLVRIINFGFFDWLAVPLLRALKWIHGYVSNYGWSIIILTFLINLVMFPLRHKSVVSMRKMQEIQPEIKAIQDRYGKMKTTDPERQKMNVEMMNLYRERGVNPASGCVPMLLTFPVLFAFYSLLSQAIELRGAPFALWIKDLSMHDPLYVTPILMGITMVWQQKMTPTSADPVQQKMMMAMPLVFTFMFLWAPSGLVIYWFVSNLLAIGQQYVTNNMIGHPAKAPRPPAERRVRKAS